MTQKLFFPLADHWLPPDRVQRHAVLTGEYRHPKKGEWYLSGAIPEAYRVYDDLDMSYAIVKIVKTKTVTVIEEVP